MAQPSATNNHHSAQNNSDQQAHTNTTAYTGADLQIYLEDTQRWLEKAVIGLNLCPFAKAVHVKGEIAYFVSMAEDTSEILKVLKEQLISLVEGENQKFDTALIILPMAFPDFYAFNDFLYKIDKLLRRSQLDGIIQVASFHPRFQFEDTEEDEISNYTNRSPHPTLHLIREESMDKAVEAFPDAELIYEANIQTLEKLGLQGWKALDLEPRACPHTTKGKE